MAGGRSFVTRQEIRGKYSVGANVVKGWIARPSFPAAQAPAAAGADRGREAERFDEVAVDAWVREHENRLWLATHEGKEAAREAALRRLPQGGPGDLLDLDDFRTLLGEFNRGKPIARTTMQSYRSRQQIPAADRREGDGLRPEVYEDMWFRATVYDYIVSQPGMGGRGVGRVARRDP
ncbi:hypothetical protein ACFY00_33060 [Kitasatospora sp. NPDC001540]|uniref:hypothetical protein n=1 Tax=Kitasatospora sp. NPDC001540 TaxID=3364014 RepID=UPI00369668A8